MFSRILSNRYLILGLRLVLGGLFIWASLYKISHPAEFAENIYNYRMLPAELVNLMAIVMPWLELICGTLIILGPMIRGSALLVSLMLGIFIIALSGAIARGLDITCGCFGGGGRPVAIETLLEDIPMLIAAVIIVVFGRPSPATGRW